MQTINYLIEYMSMAEYRFIKGQVYTNVIGVKYYGKRNSENDF